MKLVKRLILSLNNWIQLQTNPHWRSLSDSSKSYEREERQMENEFNYSTDQMAEIYAKLEVSKMLIKLGTDMAKQASDDIRFFKMTNNIED